MNSLVFVLSGLLIIIAFIGANIGLRFNKWQGWLFVLLGFCGGFLFSLYLPSENINRDPYFALLLACIISFFVFYYGWKQGKNNDKIKAMWKKIFGNKDD